MSKLTLRVPTKDQYAFVEVETDFTVGTPEQVKEEYDKLYAVMNGKETPPNAFYSYLIALMDSNLATWGSADNYEALNDKQKEVVQSIKKFAKRIK